MATYFILFVILNIVCRVKCEPRCSKFDFEENLLEKMIRLEFNVGQMLKETQQLSESVKKELSEFRKENMNSENKVQAGLDDLNKDRIKLRENVSTAIDSLEMFSQELNDTMELYRDTTTRGLKGLIRL